jgi:cytoskeletal protein RodZ
MSARSGISRALVAGLVVVVVIIVAALVALVGVPGTQPTNPTTTSTVSTPANLQVSTNQNPTSYCSQPTSPYGNSSLTISWGNLAPGTEGIQFVCLKNTGTTATKIAVNSSLTASIGKVTSPQAGTTLYGGAAELVELDLWLTPIVQPGPLQSFTVTIGGTQ